MNKRYLIANKYVIRPRDILIFMVMAVLMSTLIFKAFTSYGIHYNEESKASMQYDSYIQSLGE